MESLQEDVTELRATLGNRMNQFMEVIQAMAKGQEELRAAIQRPPIAETTTQNANLVPPPVIVQPTPTIGFVPPAGLVFTPMAPVLFLLVALVSFPLVVLVLCLPKVPGQYILASVLVPVLVRCISIIINNNLFITKKLRSHP